MQRVVLFTVFLLAATWLCGEDIEDWKKAIEANSIAELPDYLGNRKVPDDLVEAAKTVVENADKIIANEDADDKDKRWAVQRKAVSLIILAYSDVTHYYTPLIQIGDELEKRELKKLAGLVEKHVLTIGVSVALQTKIAEDGSSKGINLQALAERIVLYAETYPGQETERLLDMFLMQIRQLPPSPRDKRLAIVAPIFQKHYQEINYTSKAAALQSDIDRSTLPGKSMALIGVKLDGGDFDLNSIKDKVVLIQFWGTWCPHCKEEMPDLIRLYEKYHSKGLEIVGINTAVKGDESVERVKKFIELQTFDNKRIPYTVLHEGLAKKKYGMTITQQYGIDELPVLVLIGRDGKVSKLYPLPSTLDDQIGEAVSLQSALQFTEEEKQQIEEAKKKREAEEQRKIDEELK